MLCLQASFKIKQFQKRQPYYLQQSTTNIYLLLNGKMYPCHRQFLQQSKFISRQLQKLQTTIIQIQKGFKNEIFSKILLFLYGQQIRYRRDQQTLYILEIVQYLQISMLKNLILQDIKINTDEYQIFVLFTIAQKYQQKWLMDYCIDELTLMDFQQMNYNKYQLLQCQKSIFSQLISLFLHFQQQKRIKGMSQQQLKKIIQEYNQCHNYQANDKVNINLYIAGMMKLYCIKQANQQLQRSQTINDRQIQKKEFEQNFNTNFGELVIRGNRIVECKRDKQRERFNSSGSSILGAVKSSWDVDDSDDQVCNNRIYAQCQNYNSVHRKCDKFDIWSVENSIQETQSPYISVDFQSSDISFTRLNQQLQEKNISSCQCSNTNENQNQKENQNLDNRRRFRFTCVKYNSLSSSQASGSLSPQKQMSLK